MDNKEGGIPPVFDEFVKFKAPTTIGEWGRLIRDRMRTVLPLMDTITLDQIGNEQYPMNVAGGYGPYHGPLGATWNKWLTTKRSFNQKTQGIFSVDVSEAREAFTNPDKSKGTMYLFGYARRIGYVRSEINFTRRKNSDGWSIILDPISIDPSLLESIHNTTLARKFWWEIGRVVKYAHEMANERVEALAKHKQVVDFENLLMEQMVPK